MPSGRGRRAIARRLAVSVVLLLAVGLVLRARPGSGQSTDNECLATFEGVPAGDENGGTIMCDDRHPPSDWGGGTPPHPAPPLKTTPPGDKPPPPSLAPPPPTLPTPLHP